MGRRGRRHGPYGVGDDEDDLRVTARSLALDAELTRLMGDGRIIAAARVGASFGLDPVALLAERDPFNTKVRVAAHNVLQNDAKRAEKASK